ncbi:MAG: carboxypeptidase regulatory-like domain-containing protein [Candidatus Diapherotrites archaeon]|nr:carboxypeptidase regulatory-like domain-containing protein [Candidatus Diapherotrites archaeon]
MQSKAWFFLYDKPEESGKYDSPSSGDEMEGVYEDSPLDKAKETGLKILDVLKAHKKKIAIAVIGLLALFLLYDFFIGSVKEITFIVNDTEGIEVSGASVKILGADGKTIATVESGGKTSLRKGAYHYSVIAGGYKTPAKTAFEVADNAEITAILEKNLDVELSLEEQFPEKLVLGQIETVNVLLKNDSQSTEEIELVFEGSLGEKIMTASYEKPVSVPPGQKTVPVTLQVKTDLSNSEIKSGLLGTIRVKGLNSAGAKKTVSFDLLSFDQRKVTISGTTNFGTIEEGSALVEKRFTIRNQTALDIENLDIVIAINDVQYSSIEDVGNWFTFSREVPIPEIRAGASQEIGIRVTVPVGEINFPPGAGTENIGGQIVFKTSFFEIAKELDLVASKSSTSIELSGLSNQTIQFDDDTGSYQTKAGTLTLRNTGSLVIQNLSLSVECSDEPAPWVIIGDSFIAQVDPRETKQVNYIIQAPSSIDSGSVMICSVTATFDNPRKIAPLRVEESKSFNLTFN